MANSYAEALSWMLNLGYTQADLDQFIRANGAQDIRRIESAFNTYNDRALVSGTQANVAAATAAALSNVSSFSVDSLDHTGMISPIAVPTPIAAGVGQITQTSPNDALISGESASTGPRLAYSAATQATPGTLAGVASGIPVWVWIVAAIGIVVLMQERGRK